MTLASAGRQSTKLWDVATGRLLLDIESGNYVPTLAFSPDGYQIAAGFVKAHGSPQAVEVWKLETGRGIQTLRGLTAQSMKTALTGDGHLVAALCDDWQVGIWDGPANRLLHVLEVTPGHFTDSAALAFSPDGRQFAFSAGHEASLWDVGTGELIRSWRCPKASSNRWPSPSRTVCCFTAWKPYPVKVVHSLHMIL